MERGGAAVDEVAVLKGDRGGHRLAVDDGIVLLDGHQDVAFRLAVDRGGDLRRGAEEAGPFDAHMDAVRGADVGGGALQFDFVLIDAALEDPEDPDLRRRGVLGGRRRRGGGLALR